jgi:hypothetical protein
VENFKLKQDYSNDRAYCNNTYAVFVCRCKTDIKINENKNDDIINHVERIAIFFVLTQQVPHKWRITDIIAKSMSLEI